MEFIQYDVKLLIGWFGMCLMFIYYQLIKYPVNFSDILS